MAYPFDYASHHCSQIAKLLTLPRNDKRDQEKVFEFADRLIGEMLEDHAPDPDSPLEQLLMKQSSVQLAFQDIEFVREILRLSIAADMPLSMMMLDRVISNLNNSAYEFGRIAKLMRVAVQPTTK